MRHSFSLFLISLSFCFCVSHLHALDESSIETKERPISFISDPSNWLPRETKGPLESFLRARSNSLGIDIFVLLTPLPPRSREERKSFLRDLGNSWSKKNWSIISYKPGQIGAPIIVSGGPFKNETDPKIWESEMLLLQDLSLQSWDQQPDIDFLAREVSDSIVFASRFKDAITQVFVKKRKSEYEKEQLSLKSRKIYLTSITIASLLALIIGGLLLRKAYQAYRKRRFPSTKWSPRLGSPHSGGSAVVHRFKPPQT